MSTTAFARVRFADESLSEWQEVELDVITSKGQFALTNVKTVRFKPAERTFAPKRLAVEVLVSPIGGGCYLTVGINSPQEIGGWDEMHLSPKALIICLNGPGVTLTQRDFKAEAEEEIRKLLAGEED
jgi:hypothetical protein